jgi:ammonia channel protein AmtB
LNSFGVHAVDGILDALATGFLATPVANANLVTSLKALSQKTEKRMLSLELRAQRWL